MIDQKSNKKIKIILISILIIACILIIISTIFAVFNSMNDKILRGISIQGINVSELTKEDTERKFKEIIDNIYNKKIILKYGELENDISFEELEINYHINEAIEEACKKGRESNIFKNNFDIIKIGIFKKDIPINIDYNEEVLDNKITSILANLPGAVQEYSYYIENENLIITEGREGITIDKEELKQLIKNEIEKIESNTAFIEIPVINKIPDEINLEKIRSEIYKEAQDAYITEDPLTVHPNINGVDFAISIDEAKEILKEDKEEYIIPLKITIADKTISDLGEEAFPNILGTFTTRYDASNKNRSNNITLASEKINGTVILPGETFSYNQIVGKRTIDAGYKEAGAYAGGKVIQEVGGGICQVSSTLYNAVLYANLEIVDRSNHYFQTSYVDAGRDATVSWGTVDFKFKNNREYPIKIDAVSKNGVTKISIKGIKEEKEYEVVIQSEITSIIQKSVKYEEDPLLDSSVEQVEQEGHNGCTSKTYKILKFNGAIVSTELISTDYYHSLEKIIKKGTKQSIMTEQPEDNSDEMNNITNEINNETIKENIV
ncbi:MAG: VanW family protein [Clostridia bacterium]